MNENRAPINVRRLEADMLSNMKNSEFYVKAKKNYRKNVAIFLGSLAVSVILFSVALDYMVRSADLMSFCAFIGACVLMVAVIIVMTIRLRRAQSVYQVSMSDSATEYMENFVKQYKDGGRE